MVSRNTAGATWSPYSTVQILTATECGTLAIETTRPSELEDKAGRWRDWGGLGHTVKILSQKKASNKRYTAWDVFHRNCLAGHFLLQCGFLPHIFTNTYLSALDSSQYLGLRGDLLLILICLQFATSIVHMPNLPASCSQLKH